VLFPPGATVADLEALRRRWDPVMAARIDAHVTLVHDVTDHSRTNDLVATAAAATEAFSVRLTDVARWGPARGIYIGIDDSSASVTALHEVVAPLESPGWLRHGFRPHVTIVHGRYVLPETAEEAWVAMRTWRAARDVAFDRVSVIEMDVDGWTTVAEVALTGP